MRFPVLLIAAGVLGCLLYFPLASGETSAETRQGDATCDQVVDAEDVIAILAEVGGLEFLAACLDLAGDVNCDGAIDELDALWLIAGLADVELNEVEDCVVVGDALPADEAPGESGLVVEIAPRLACNSAVPEQTVHVEWEYPDPPVAVDVKIDAAFSWGPAQSQNHTDATGSTDFVVADQGPGSVTITLTISEPPPSGVVLASDQQVILLDTCFPPATPAPVGAGFVTLPTPGPPDPPLAAPPGDIVETDVVHLGGSPNGPTRDISVVAVGTGATWTMFSYNTDFTTRTPIQIGQSRLFAGHSVKLLALSPALSPKLGVALLVTAYINGGNLWIATWRVDEDGDFTSLGRRGYGENAGAIVQRFGIAHRQTPGSGAPISYQVVTPVFADVVTPQSGDPEDGLRTVTWSVNATTGDVNGLHDVGPWGAANPDTDPAIAHLSGDTVGNNLYVVSYVRSNYIMANAYWTVSDSGFPVPAGSASSGVDIQGDDNVTQDPAHIAVAPLADGGFLTAGANTGLDLVTSWESRVGACDGGCFFVPHNIADQTLDTQSGAGVDVDSTYLPSLTDGQSNKVAGGAVQPVRALLTDALWEEFGVGSGEVYLEMPPIPPGFPSVGIASVGKTMTLLLVAEAIDDGEVTLGTEITASETAINAGGSLMGLSEGETHTLSNLLWGMMIPSGNDAAFAIGEHIAGSVEDWVDRMNTRAGELGMDDSIYSRPSGGAYSTPQDQVTLWMEGWQHEVFRNYSGPTSVTACGEDAEQDEVCYFYTKNAFYPGVQGWKSGSTGFSIPEYKALGVPLCTSCRLGSAERLGRQFIVMLQQTGAATTDQKALWDYGFAQLFTPDRVGASVNVTASDWALDGISDGLLITSHIDGEDLHVCTWDVSADLGQITQADCSDPRVPATMPGGPSPRITFVDLARISTLLYEGDYVTGDWLAGHFTLRLWRVGPREP